MQCAPTTATTTTTLLVAFLFLWPVNNRQPHAHKTHAPLAALLPLLLYPLPLLTFWKTIKAIKKSLYKLAALAVYFFSSHHSLPLDTVRRPMASLRLLCQRMRRCAERDSETVCALLWRLFTEQPLGNSSSLSSPLLALY